MDCGNAGPGNVNANNFERLGTEAPAFNLNILPTPDQKEQDPGQKQESVGNNTNRDNAPYIDPALIGDATIKATAIGNVPIEKAKIGEVVSEGAAGLKTLSEDQTLGTDLNSSKFDKNGVSKAQEDRLDWIKKEPNLYKQNIDFMLESKKALSASFADRGYLAGDEK